MTEAPAPSKPSDFPIPKEWEEEKTITLAGRKWAIPPMTGRSIAKFTGRAAGLQVGPTMLQRDDSLTEDENEAKVENSLRKLYELIHIGLNRAYPALDFETFYDMAVTPNELFAAFVTVGEAAGLEMKKVAPGEAQAAPLTAEQPLTDSKTS